MGRSTKKGPYVDDKLFEKVMAQKQKGAREPIKTWARSCTIVPEFVGHKLGEFAHTRNYHGHQS